MHQYFEKQSPYKSLHVPEITGYGNFPKNYYIDAIINEGSIINEGALACNFFVTFHTNLQHGLICSYLLATSACCRHFMCKIWTKICSIHENDLG